MWILTLATVASAWPPSGVEWPQCEATIGRSLLCQCVLDSEDASTWRIAGTLGVCWNDIAVEATATLPRDLELRTTYRTYLQQRAHRWNYKFDNHQLMSQNESEQITDWLKFVKAPPAEFLVVDPFVAPVATVKTYSELVNVTVVDVDLDGIDDLVITNNVGQIMTFYKVDNLDGLEVEAQFSAVDPDPKN